MSPAGARRNRKNAVELNVPEYDEPRTNGRGRPSKGGELVRAHRYYAKKHMLILQKRRLKRYTDKVKKILEECDYDSRNVSKAIDDAFKKNTKIRKIFKKKDLLISANLIRDDRYLHFLNQHEQEHINELFANDSEKTSIPDQVQVDAEQLLQKHSVAAMTFSALVSAFLLTKYIETAIESATTLEKKQACLTLYKTSYNHLTGDSQGSERRPSKQFVEVKLEPVDITWPEEVEQDDQSNREFTGEESNVESQEEESKVEKNCESEENSSEGEESEVDSQSEESEDENDGQSKDSEGEKNSQSTSSSSSSSGSSDGESEEESSRKKRRVSP